MNNRFLLKSISLISSGSVAPKDNQFSNVGLPFIRAGHLAELIEDASRLELLPKIDDETALELKLKKVSPGSVLFAKSGMSSTKNRVFLCPKEAYIVNHLAAIEPNEKVIKSEYLKCFLEWFKPSKLIVDESYPSIRISDIGDIEVVVPSIPKQNSIINTLEVSKRLIEIRKKQIVALDELAQSLFLEMFGDPQTNKNNYLIEPLTKFYEHPKDAIKCGPFGSALKKEEFVQDGIPVWNMDNITKQNEFIDCPKLFVTEEKAEQLKNYNVQNGDIIISRAGTVGKMSVVDSKYENSLISTNLIRLRLNEKLKPEFLVWLIKIFGDKVCRMRTGNDGAFSHMNTSVLNNIYFPYPPLEKQQEFLNKLIAIKNQKESFNKSLREFEILYNALLQKAFKGELFQNQP